MAIGVLTATGPPGSAAAAHTCDPVTDPGWSVIAEDETLSQADSPPYLSGSDWFVNRVTTVLPYCHYYNSIGIYSMRSYSLDPVVTEERIAICRPSGNGSAAVAPYPGPCPPR